MVEQELGLETESQKTQHTRLTNEQKRELVCQAREKGLLDPFSRAGDHYRYTDVRAPLTDRERSILRRRFPVEGLIISQAEVGRELEVTKAQISSVELRTLGKLQYQLSKSPE